MQGRKRASLLLAVATFASFGSSASADPPRWTFLDLGAQFNTVEAQPSYGVNDLGQVTGFGTSAFVQGAPQGPFVTQPNTPVNWASRPGDPPVNPTLFVDQVVNGTYNNSPWNPDVDLTLRPAPSAVNNHGVTTGWGYSYPHSMAFLGTTTQTTAIGPTGEVCVGYAINDANEVAGIKAVESWTHAVHIAGGVRTDLGSFRTQPVDMYGRNDHSVAYGINQSGVVVGYATNDVFVGPGNEQRAFRWTQATGLQDLGNLGGPRAVAYDINNSGQVTGYVMDVAHSTFAAVWSPTNVMTVIPNSVNWTGRWITDAGWVVCVAGANYLLYHEGQTYDLLTLLDDDGTHWNSIVITDVSSSGHMTGYALNDNTSSGARRAFLLTPGGVTATALALIDAEATAERVTLRWHSSSQNLQAKLQRRDGNQAWSYRADVQSDASGQIRYEDTDIVPGRRYGYRLEVTGEGQTEYLGEAWVEVPDGLALRMRGFHPNPSAGTPTVSFALPNTGPARLELLDAMSRRVATREWASLQGGSHTITLSGEARLRPGVYVVRLTSAGRTVSANGVILEP